MMAVYRFRSLCAAGACIALLSAGCVAPYARYTRPSRQAHAAAASSYKVPRNWDYRTSYSVPPQRLASIIEKYIGTPYRYGGMSRAGMDCSGFVKIVFSELNRARLPRSSRAMYRLGRPVAQKDARPGDLVFFRSGAFNRIDHVGIYVGEGKFAHASRKKGVIYSDLADEYYRGHCAGIRRIF